MTRYSLTLARFKTFYLLDKYILFDKELNTHFYKIKREFVLENT